MKGYPRWFLPVLVGSTLLALLSGLLLIPTTMLTRFDVELGWRLPGPARTGTAALHAADGFMVLMLLGALWGVHMRAGWRRGAQRASGLLLSVGFLVLAGTAVAVYYLGEATAGSSAAALHTGAGLLLVLPFAWHWLRGRGFNRDAMSTGISDASTRSGC